VLKFKTELVGPITATTICVVRRDGKTAIAGDGQVTHNEMVLKSSARKIRRLFEGKVVVGFAGGVADALTLFERFEGKIKEYKDLKRAAVELAKDWRTDKYLRRLEALLLAADKDSILIISGTGDVIEADEGYAAIGSGAEAALAALKALYQNTSLSAPDIAKKALEIAASINIFTNSFISLEVLE